MRSALALLVVAVAVVPGCGRGASATRGPKPVKARVLTVEHKEVRRDVHSVGSLFPFEEVTVSSEVEGRVEQVLVDVGDRVARGQALVKVAARGARARRRAAARRARADRGPGSGSPEGGDDLRDPSDAAEVKRAQAALEDAQQKYQRAKSLYDEGLISTRHLRRGGGAATSRRKAAYDMARADRWRTCAPSCSRSAPASSPRREEAARHRHPRALRRPGEGAHGDARASTCACRPR